MNVLYLVGPFGEGQDLTLRARDVLRRASLVVLHDAAQARPYLDRLGIAARLLESGGEDVLPAILDALAEGDVAWLAMRFDEWTGPSHRLARALLDRGIDLVSVPGASAMVGGLVASGLPVDRFTALGVLPASQAERLTLWPGVAREAGTVVCEVRAGSLDQVLEEVQAYLGDRRIAVARGEDVWRGRASLAETLVWSGRVTLVIEGAAARQDWTRERVLAEVRALLDAGASARDAAREVARRSGLPRRQVYELTLLASRDEE